MSAEATIMDVNNQALVTSNEITVHPSRIYIGNVIHYFSLSFLGTKLAKYISIPNEPLALEFVAVDTG